MNRDLLPADQLRASLLAGRRPLSDSEMDITPMIDMVFLLLIFFLVASKIDQATSVKLPSARRALAIAQETAVIVLVKQDAGSAVVVARRDGTPFSADPALQEEEIGAYVEAGLSGSPPFERPMESIIIKAEGSIRAGEVARVARAIGQVTDIPVLNYAVVEQL